MNTILILITLIFCVNNTLDIRHMKADKAPKQDSIYCDSPEVPKYIEVDPKAGQYISPKTFKIPDRFSHTAENDSVFNAMFHPRCTVCGEELILVSTPCPDAARYAKEGRSCAVYHCKWECPKCTK